MYDDDKIIAVPFNDPNFNHYKCIDELPPHIINEIEHFFMVYKDLEHKSTTGFKIESKENAINIIVDAMNEYNSVKDKLIKKNTLE